MAGRPSKFTKPESASAGEVERALELGEIDEAMASKYYPDDDQRRADFVDFLRALRPGTPNPKSNTRAVHVYLYDEALPAFYEGWRELVVNREIKSGDSMSRVVATMIIGFARLSKLAKELHWEEMREKLKERAAGGPAPPEDQDQE